MNTLTYVKAWVKAFGLALCANRIPSESKKYKKRYARYARQSQKFAGKVAKRLQEQEEGSNKMTLDEVRRKYFPDTDFTEYDCKCPRCRYHRSREWKPLKEKVK